MNNSLVINAFSGKEPVVRCLIMRKRHLILLLVSILTLLTACDRLANTAPASTDQQQATPQHEEALLKEAASQLQARPTEAMLATVLGYDDNKRVRVNRRSFYYPDRFEPVGIESLSRRCQAVILPDGTEMTYDGVEVNTQNAARFDTEVRRWAETNRYRLPYPTVEIESVDWFWDWNDDRHVQAARVTYYPATYHIRIMLNAQPHSPCLSRLISKQKADPIDAYLAFYEDGNDWVITRLPVGIGLRSGPYTLSKNHDYPLSPQLR